jgi:tight adherence protein B
MIYIIIIAVGVLGALLLGGQAMSGPSPRKAQKRRMELIKERHADGILAANAQAQIEGIFSTLIPKPALMRTRLEQTGKPITLGKYAMASIGMAVFVASLAMLKGAPFMLAFFVGLFAGVAVPHFVVGFLIKRRINQFNSNFPDAIELMVRGLRSGLPITETLGIVAGEISGPVGLEFRAVADKMKIGRTMEAALQETAERLGTAEFQFFVITLAIQRETGGNLAETLSNLADVLRKRAQMKLKIRAMSSESKASAYIVGSLPFVVFTLVWMINPNYMQGFFVDQRLIVAGLGGLTWMGIGVFIMAKMVNFEI